MKCLTFVFALIAALPIASAAKDKCIGKPVELGRNVDVIEAFRGFKGADGQSHIDRITLPGAKGEYYGGAVHITHFDLGDPSAAVLVYGVPNMVIPIHPVPYREIFIFLSGSSEMLLADGSKYVLKAGSMFISEDLDTPGRGGRSGPCGYVALALQFKKNPPP